MSKVVDVKNEISDVLAEAEKMLGQIDSLQDLEVVRVKFLGKKSPITAMGKHLATCDPQLRPELGAALNQAKERLKDLISARQMILNDLALDLQLQSETLDVSLPGRGQKLGSLHPVSSMMHRAIQILQSIGFSVHEGHEIEDYYHNFEALNIPKHHPALSMHDTFYGDFDQRLLRTQTSCGQIHVLENQSPPVRVITPGKVYRRDSDPTHTPMFHQLEGLVVDLDCHFSQLKSLIHQFLSALLRKDIHLRFRPSYFPFTEPSAEVDLQCHKCRGKGCALCKNTGWLEVLGCGMVHPQVLENVGVDPAVYNGYAFGLGIDRIAMLYYEIDDLRLLFENDVRFLNQV